jgi:hypothetical protein
VREERKVKINVRSQIVSSERETKPKLKKGKKLISRNLISSGKPKADLNKNSITSK